jgi:hypothetical protein
LFLKEKAHVPLWLSCLHFTRTHHRQDWDRPLLLFGKVYQRKTGEGGESGDGKKKVSVGVVCFNFVLTLF